MEKTVPIQKDKSLGRLFRPCSPSSWGPNKSRRVMKAMLKMKKLDIRAPQEAYEGS